MNLVNRSRSRLSLRNPLTALLFTLAAVTVAAFERSGFDITARLCGIPIAVGAAWVVGTPVAVVVAALLAAGGRLPASIDWATFPRFLELCCISVLAGMLRQAKVQAHDSARSDSLTGIANRRAFLEQVEAEVARVRQTGQPVSIAYFDCDHFKAANDRFGHAVGDEILKLVAASIRANIRSSDCVARLGGDEFAVLFVDSPPETAGTVVERIRRKLQATLSEQGRPVSFSVGVATLREPVKSAEELLCAADETMYSVKRSTRDGVACVVV